MTSPVSRRVTILGVTGSVGTNTADLIAEANRATPGRFDVFAVTAQSNVRVLAERAKGLNAEVAVVADEARYAELRDALSGTGIRAAAGVAALEAAAGGPATWTMAAIVGTAGLRPTLAALKPGNTVALANKECLVSAGALFMQRAAQTGSAIIPVDSEHSAIFQLLEGKSRSDVARVTLTASGGPFRDWPIERMAAANVSQACAHPNWAMGQKISIDSATLMNKGLELIEAHFLFGIAPELLEAIVHPQSVVHGLVTMSDGQVFAHLSQPHMRLPIAHALSYPERWKGDRRVLSLAVLGGLTFEPPDLARFPCLRLALDALQAGGVAPTILNAANEVAVEAFRTGRLGFLGIPTAVEETLTRMASVSHYGEAPGLDALLALDAEARHRCAGIVSRIAAR